MWTQTLEDRQKELDEFERKKEKERHANYYQKHRKRIIRKQKQCNRLADRKTYSREYYEKNRDTLIAKHKLSYQKNRKDRLEWQRQYYLEHREEILAKRKRKRSVYDKSGEDKGADRQSEKLVVGCIPAIQN